MHVTAVACHCCIVWADSECVGAVYLRSTLMVMMGGCAMSCCRCDVDCAVYVSVGGCVGVAGFFALCVCHCKRQCVVVVCRCV